MSSDWNPVSILILAVAMMAWGIFVGYLIWGVSS